MKRLSMRAITGPLAALCLIIIFINMLGLLFDCRYISVFAAAEDAYIYEVRSRLLIEAMEDIGVCNPEQAALVWAKGLKMRNAALQYSVMSEELRKQYAQELEKNNSNWVTGLSSPWVDSYKITSIETKDGSLILKMLISTRTSTGPADEYQAILTVRREGEFWRITEITADSGLYPYIGLRQI